MGNANKQKKVPHVFGLVSDPIAAGVGIGVEPMDHPAHLVGGIAAILASRSLDDWMADFIAHDISAMPVNDLHELARDPHYLARANTYQAEIPGAGTLTLTGTPIRLEGAAFAPAPPPGLGQHTDAVLASVAGLDTAEIAQLRAQGIVG